MKIAVEGCAHGELEKIYDSIQSLEEREGYKVDLLICCGDFQATRNDSDLRCMAVPPKYYNICTFYKYYAGEKTAPMLTIFIGGNHEASNHLQELPYGGWVAPNIYYMGYASVINIAGIRIGGISGIYKGQDYLKGRYEKAPYSEDTKRSVYHIRSIDVFRLKQITKPIDIFLSHDWPRGVYHHGNLKQLLKFKPYFKDDIDSDKLGSKPCEDLLNELQPNYWFAAHLHCKFAAIIPHSSGDKGKKTKFLALDKCLPRRRFLQIVDIPHNEKENVEITYDLEWLTILHLTNHLLSIKSIYQYMPGPGFNGRWNFTPTKEEKEFIQTKFGDLKVPKNFVQTAVPYSPTSTPVKNVQQPSAQTNPQTEIFCNKLGIDDPLQLLLLTSDKNDLSVSNQTLPTDVTFDTNSTYLSSSDLNDSTSSSKSFNSPFIPRSVELKLPELRSPKTCNANDEVVSNFSPLNRSKMNLPPPKRNVDVNETENSDSGTDLGILDLPVTLSEEITSTPEPKKFKRRNESIYSAEND